MSKMCRRQPLDQILGRSVTEDIKSSPQGSGSPGTSANDRAAAKRADLRRQEQERRRREAVSIAIFKRNSSDLRNFKLNQQFPYLLTYSDGWTNRYEYAK